MRYSRQEKFLRNLENFDENFQEDIKNKRIIVVGCGGVGSVLSELLVRGGFLNLVLVDNDIIDETNLQRQIFFEADIGKTKSKALKDYLRIINTNSRIECIVDIVDYKYSDDIFRNADLILDCTDNFAARKLINDYCEKNGKDWIYNGAVKTEIMSATFFGKNKSFSKIFPEDIVDEKCCDVGVLASTTFSGASLAYNKVLKYFLGIEDNNLIKINLWDNTIHEVALKVKKETVKKDK